MLSPLPWTQRPPPGGKCHLNSEFMREDGWQGSVTALPVPLLLMTARSSPLRRTFSLPISTAHDVWWTPEVKTGEHCLLASPVTSPRSLGRWLPRLAFFHCSACEEVWMQYLAILLKKQNKQLTGYMGSIKMKITLWLRNNKWNLRQIHLIFFFKALNVKTDLSDSPTACLCGFVLV